MTKKEFTVLLMCFCGSWLFIVSLVALVSGLFQIGSQYSLFFSEESSRHAIVLAGLAIIPVALYGTFAYVLVRKSSPIADRLLRFGRIDSTEVVHGGAVAGLSPLLYSLVGLYFLVTNLPSLLRNAAEWFVQKATLPTHAHLSSKEVAGALAQYESNLIYYGLSVALALFVLLRSQWIARQVAAFGERKSGN